MHTKQLLEFIMEQYLELPEYYKLIPLIKKKFNIKKRGGGVQDFTKELVEKVIHWEMGNQTASLEVTLEENFLIYKI